MKEQDKSCWTETVPIKHNKSTINGLVIYLLVRFQKLGDTKLFYEVLSGTISSGGPQYPATTYQCEQWKSQYHQEILKKGFEAKP